MFSPLLSTELTLLIGQFVGVRVCVVRLCVVIEFLMDWLTMRKIFNIKSIQDENYVSSYNNYVTTVLEMCNNLFSV